MKEKKKYEKVWFTYIRTPAYDRRLDKGIRKVDPDPKKQSERAAKTTPARMKRIKAEKENRFYGGVLLNVESSNMEQAGIFFNEHLKFHVARIVFHNGRVYDHFPMNFDLFGQFLASESKGKFYNQFIKSDPTITIEEVTK